MMQKIILRKISTITISNLLNTRGINSTIFLAQLILGVGLVLALPSLSNSQQVTLTVGDGAGINGARCRNPNSPYENNNEVVVSLENLSHEVAQISMEIEESADDFLTVEERDGVIRCETALRAQDLTCTVT